MRTWPYCNSCENKQMGSIFLTMFSLYLFESPSFFIPNAIITELSLSHAVFEVQKQSPLFLLCFILITKLQRHLRHIDTFIRSKTGKFPL